MSPILRRLVPIALAAALLVSVTPAGAAAATSTAEAEMYLVRLINAQRADLGLRAVRWDWRVRKVARLRSDDMVKHGYFGHTHSDGSKAWDLMTRAGITWYWAGEIIAMNSWGSLEDSARAASRGWHDSPGHNAIISDRDYNYIGLGYAWDPERGHIWTAVFLKGPDRTGAWARLTSASTLAAGSQTVTVRWKGGDVLLSVLTSGLRHFQLQRRTDGGRWVTLYSATTRTSWSAPLARGHRYEFRVRSRDKAGNWGAWTPTQAVRL